MNYGSKSLADLYGESVRGNVPPRRHLRMLGEENTPQEKEEVIINRERIKDAIDRLDIDDTDVKQMEKLYNRIISFSSYRSIKNTLSKKGYNPLILKKFSNDIQSLTEDLPEEDKQQFTDYLTSDNQAVFPSNLSGDLYSILASSGVPRSAVEKIVKHTAQDEGGKGVGMGELALSLVFDNVESAGSAKMKALKEAEQRLADAGWRPRMRKASYTPQMKAAFADMERAKAKVKGDLELNGEEFEIKGEGGSLGPRPDAIHKSFGKTSDSFFKDYGLTVNNQKYILNNKQIGNQLGEFPLALSETYKSLEPGREESFIQDVKRFLINNARLEEATNTVLFDRIDFNDPRSIQRGISLMSFFEYANEEKFKHFMAHDIGAAGGGNLGKYVYVKGSPLAMAEQLRNTEVKFEKVAYNKLRPRIGFHGTYSDEEYIN